MKTNVDSSLKDDEAVLKEMIRAVRDVLMLRLAKISVETTMTPTMYD